MAGKDFDTGPKSGTIGKYDTTEHRVLYKIGVFLRESKKLCYY